MGSLYCGEVQARQVGRSHRVGLAVSLWACLPVADALGFRSGPPAARDGSPGAGGNSCRECHGSTLGSGSIQIIGFPSQYELNAIYGITVRISDPTQSGAGFQASVQTESGQPAGTVIRSDVVNTQLNQRSFPTAWRGINHTSTGVSNAVSDWLTMGNSATYNFQWRAPTSDLGSLTAWAAGNAINNNFTNSGDHVYLASVMATFGGFPPGACCDESTGICTEDQAEDSCLASGSRFGGDGSTCATLSPPCTEASGACCNDSTGTCSEDALRSYCESSGYRFGGGFSTCATIDPPCEQPTGACCNGNTGTCTDAVAEATCVGEQTTWTREAACESLDPPCVEHTGACCDLVDGECSDEVPGSLCSGSQQSWTKGAACSAVACEAATGACCNHDPFGGCVDGLIEAECDCPTCEWAKGGVCGDEPCDLAAIPTVGGWGLVVLTLLLLTAAKIGFTGKVEVTEQ